MMDDSLSVTWRPVRGLEGWYEVSDRGDLRRIRPGKGTRSGRAVTGYLDRKGYRRTTITCPKGIRKVGFHTLVAEAFLGERPAGKRLVRHPNGLKADNRASNLAWGTDAENAQDEVTSGRSKNRPNRNREKSHCPAGHEYTADNTRLDKINRRYCRACRREAWAAAPGIPRDDPRHGTVNGYLNGKCRCPACRTANTDYQRERRSRQ